MSSERGTGSAATIPSAERPSAGTRRNQQALEPTVVDDRPDIAPAALDVIETRLGSLLDEILTPPGKPTRRPAPKSVQPISRLPPKGHRHE